MASEPQSGDRLFEVTRRSYHHKVKRNIFMAAAIDGFVKISNARHANFAIMRRTCCTLNDGEMQHNAEVGLFTKPSILIVKNE